MAVRNYDVKPAIVVQIEEGVAPSDVGKRRIQNPGIPRNLIESLLTPVPKQVCAFLGEGCDQNIRPPVMIEIRNGDAHRRLRPALSIHRGSREQAGLLRGPGALVAV